MFATYDKGKAWNIQLHIQVGDCLYALDSTSYCHAYYEGGKREYVVSDEAWLGGELLVKAIAENEGNNALWQFEAKGFPKRVLGKKKTLKLIALRRPIAKMKMKRNGDLGTDPRENFEALADCPDSLCQQLQWDAAGITYLRLVDNDRQGVFYFYSIRFTSSFAAFLLLGLRIGINACVFLVAEHFIDLSILYWLASFARYAPFCELFDNIDMRLTYSASNSLIT